MPKVQLYGEQQVQTKALPAARRDYSEVAVPGKAIGEGLQRFGKGVTDLWQAETKKQAEIAVMSADRQLSQYVTDRLHNPETGALNRRGKDSFGLPEEVMPEVDARIQEIEKGLSSDYQRRLFSKFANSRRVSVNDTLAKHVSGEMKRFEDEETDAYLKSEQRSIETDPSPNNVEVSLERQRLAVASYAQRNGKGAEWQTEKLNDVRSSSLLGAVNGLLAKGDDLGAQAFFDMHKDKIVGEDRTRAEKALETGLLRGASQRQADKITDEYKDPGAALEAVKEIKDPKLRDKTEERVLRHFKFLNEVGKQNADKAFINAWDVVDQTGDPDRIDPKVWASLYPKHRKAIEAFAKRRLEGKDVPNNNKKWLEFLGLSERELSEMTEADILSDHLPNFDRAHRERAMTRWANARKAASGDVAAGAKHAATRTFDDVVASTLARADVGLKLGYTKRDLSKLSEEKQAMVAEFENLADIAIKNYELVELGGKRKANSAEMQKVVDGLLLKKVFVDGGFFSRGKEKPIALLTESEREDIAVPDDERKQIEALLNKKGVPITDDLVLSIYKSAKGIR